MEGTIKIDPRIEIIGHAILHGLAGIGDAVLPILKKYGLDHIEPEQWYPLHAWLSAIYDISGGDNPMFDQVAIGMKVVDNALFPPEINSIPTVIHTIDVAYYMNHRNGEIGHYYYGGPGRTSDQSRGGNALSRFHELWHFVRRSPKISTVGCSFDRPTRR